MKSLPDHYEKLGLTLAFGWKWCRQACKTAWATLQPKFTRGVCVTSLAKAHVFLVSLVVAPERYLDSTNRNESQSSAQTLCNQLTFQSHPSSYSEGGTTPYCLLL